MSIFDLGWATVWSSSSSVLQCCQLQVLNMWYRNIYRLPQGQGNVTGYDWLLSINNLLLVCTGGIPFKGFILRGLVSEKSSHNSFWYCTLSCSRCPPVGWWCLGHEWVKESPGAFFSCLVWRARYVFPLLSCSTSALGVLLFQKAKSVVVLSSTTMLPQNAKEKFYAPSSNMVRILSNSFFTLWSLLSLSY